MFIEYYMHSDYYENQIQASSIQTTIQNFNAERFGNLVVVVPPLNEQEDISHFLQTEINLINDIISKSQSQVKMLQEKRQALITSAVTGKIDVRNGIV